MKRNQENVFLNCFTIKRYYKYNDIRHYENLISEFKDYYHDIIDLSILDRKQSQINLKQKSQIFSSKDRI